MPSGSAVSHSATQSSRRSADHLEPHPGKPADESELSKPGRRGPSTNRNHPEPPGRGLPTNRS
eukprot:925852-Prorocentrum_minimum.AAC.3